MPIRKIRNLDSQELCRHPEHEPPSHMYLENGVYEYICPSCGRRLEFTVRRPTGVLSGPPMDAQVVPKVGWWPQVSAFPDMPKDAIAFVEQPRRQGVAPKLRGVITGLEVPDDGS